MRPEPRRRSARRPASGVRRLRLRAWQPPPCHGRRSRAAGRNRAPLRDAAGRRLPRCAARTVADIATLLNLHAVQLHGREDVEYVRALRRELPAIVRDLDRAQRRPRAARRPRRRPVWCSTMATGGSRATMFDWIAGRRSSAARPRARRRRHRRAATRARRGGLAPMRSTSARRSMPAPGSKSPDKIAALFEALRPASPAAVARMRLSGRFGRFGGCYVPEILVPALEQLEAAFLDAQDDPAFAAELNGLLANYAGRPTPLTRCRNLPRNIYLKREDLLHGGAHKTNQVLGQGLLAKRMGKTRLIAETGAGQHGVATAIVGALLGFETVDLHGRRGRRAAEAQRLPDAADGRRGRAGGKRRPDAQGRDQRGAARLVGELRDHALSARHRRRAASVPDDGARVPARDRPRGARADHRAARAACPTRSSPASAAARTRSACSPTSSTIRCG